MFLAVVLATGLALVLPVAPVVMFTVMPVVMPATALATRPLAFFLAFHFLFFKPQWVDSKVCWLVGSVGKYESDRDWIQKRLPI